VVGLLAGRLARWLSAGLLDVYPRKPCTQSTTPQVNKKGIATANHNLAKAHFGTEAFK
jgi:hypothetical protein